MAGEESIEKLDFRNPKDLKRQREAMMRFDYGKFNSITAEGKFDPDVWGSAIAPNGQEFNIYTYEPFINYLFTAVIAEGHHDKDKAMTIADFGGSKGSVLLKVYQQLREDGYHAVNLLNIDEKEKELEEMRLEYPEDQMPELHAINYDLKNKLWENAINYGIARFLFPYFNEHQLPDVLANIYYTMEKGGKLIILQDGACEKERGEAFNELCAEVTAVQLDTTPEAVKESKYFASGEEMVKIAEKVGFKVLTAKELSERASDPNDRVKAFLSAEAYNSRFKLDDKLAAIQEVYKRWRDKSKGNGIESQLTFTDDPENPDNPRVERPMIYLVLEKEGDKE